MSQFRLEGTSWGPLSNPCSTQGQLCNQTGVLRALYFSILKTSRDRDYVTSLGSLFHYLCVLRVKKLSLSLALIFSPTRPRCPKTCFPFHNSYLLHLSVPNSKYHPGIYYSKRMLKPSAASRQKALQTNNYEADDGNMRNNILPRIQATGLQTISSTSRRVPLHYQ